MANRGANSELPLEDPEEAARMAELRYVNDSMPGIRRRRVGKGFSYTGLGGRAIRDRAIRRRIEALAIPPAWTDVWICPVPNGHLLATGRDQRGRKQFRYHPRWRKIRDQSKYTRVLDFAASLPKIRERVGRDLTRCGLPREKVLATIVRLLETTLIRVGNDEYAKQNKSFGLTTMRDRHVDVEGSRVRFEFKGKGGKLHTVDLRDRRLAGVVKRCRDIPGYELFQYLDENGKRQGIDSADVNDYLRKISGQGFTAKDFRTWAGTLLAAMALQEFEVVESDAQRKSNIVRAIETVAKRLGNTPAICRKCYVHPAVPEAYLDGTLIETLRQRAEKELREQLPGLRAEEAAVLVFLQQRLTHESRTRAV